MQKDRKSNLLVKVSVKKTFISYFLMIQIIINWPDGHESHFKPEFFTKYGPDGTSGDYKGYSAENTQKQLWYGDHVIGQHDFDAIANDADSLFEYLKGSLFIIY